MAEETWLCPSCGGRGDDGGHKSGCVCPGYPLDRQVDGNAFVCHIHDGERNKELAAIRKLPGHLQTAYIAQYGTGDGNEAGRFIGLVCRKCKRWHGSGHAKDCTVGKYYE